AYGEDLKRWKKRTGMFIGCSWVALKQYGDGLNRKYEGFSPAWPGSQEARPRCDSTSLSCDL
ncbi:uncharacterized, partial [Tachysurus ichikawai]